MQLLEAEAVPFPTPLCCHDLIESRGQWILQMLPARHTPGTARSSEPDLTSSQMLCCTPSWAEISIWRHSHAGWSDGAQVWWKGGLWRNARWAWSSWAALCSLTCGGGSMTSPFNTLTIHSLLLKCVIQPATIKWQLKRTSAWHCSRNRGSKQPAVLSCVNVQKCFKSKKHTGNKNFKACSCLSLCNSTSPMRKGYESWDCSARKREGFRVI